MPDNPTYRTLELLLATKGGELVVDVIKNYDERRVRRTKSHSIHERAPVQCHECMLNRSSIVTSPLSVTKRDAKTQDPTKVTKANKISREDCKAQWSRWTAARTERLYRANGFRVRAVDGRSERVRMILVNVAPTDSSSMCLIVSHYDLLGQSW